MFRFTAEEGGPVYLDLSIVDMENEIDGNNQDVTENDSIVESCTSSDEDISGTGSSSICSVWLENETEPNLLYVPASDWSGLQVLFSNVSTLRNVVLEFE